jgi:hypothetical protein
MKKRIGRKGLTGMPEAVQQRLREFGERFHVASFDHQVIDARRSFPIMEGNRFCGFGADGQEASFETVTSDTIGASGVSYAIGKRFCMPVGSWLIRVQYYTRFFIEVFEVKQLLD